MVGNVLGHELNYFVKHEIKDKKVLQRKCSPRMLQFLIDTSNVFVRFRLILVTYLSGSEETSFNKSSSSPWEQTDPSPCRFFPLLLSGRVYT